VHYPELDDRSMSQAVTALNVTSASASVPTFERMIRCWHLYFFFTSRRCNPNGKLMCSAAPSGQNFSPETSTMLDLAFIALGVGTFALVTAYAYGCDRI
jgi:hypothetical protein